MSSYFRLKSVTLGLFLILIPFLTHTLKAQNFVLSAPEAVYAGQPFRVKYTISGSFSDFQPPVWGNIVVLQGPYEESMQQTNVVNGQVTRISFISKVYLCQIPTPGTYEIPAAYATVDGKSLKTEPKKIEVLAGGRSGANVQHNSSNTQSNNDAVDLFVVTQLSQNEVYQGQPVVATMKIYTRLDLVDFENLEFPDFKGFWAKEIETPRQIRFTTESYNGKEYRVGVLRQYALYPQKSGEIKIDPLKLTVQYRVRGVRQSFFDEFMGTFQTESRAVASAVRKLKVLPLPSGAPSSFSGAVGKFEIFDNVDYKKLKTNEALTYTISVKGAGNMQLLQKPELSLPSTVEVFTPKVVENFTIKNGMQTGDVTYEFTIIPRVPGKVQIPAFEFSYFDPQKRAYSTSKGKSYEIDVEADSTQKITTVARAISKEDVQYLGKDIRHIFTGSIVLQPLNTYFVGSWIWWMILFLIILLFILLWGLLKQRQRYITNLVLVRGKRAGGVARKRLKLAKKYMNTDVANFYIELERAIWGYCADKLAIELSELSADGLQEVLHRENVPSETILMLKKVIEKCEYARYAPSAEVGSQEQIYADTIDVFEALERWLRTINTKK